jgi:hypothetical protein
MKIVREYQQNFSGVLRREWSFQFTKVYKQNPKNKLTIEVSALASCDTTNNPVPHLYFLQGLSQLSSAAATSGDLVNLEAGTFTQVMNPNDFFLGALGGGLNGAASARGDIWADANPPKIYVDELPLYPFRIYYRHPDAVVNEVGDVLNGFFISFKITEYKEDD